MADARPTFEKPKPREAVQSLLVDVATGRKKADLVVRNGRWVNVHSGEIIPGTDIAVVAGRFAYCGPDASHAIGPETTVVDAGGRHLVPGLCDAHMHVESGMVTVTEFCRAVIPHGTTSMFVDPHEIANVLGLAGVKLMHDEAAAMSACRSEKASTRSGSSARIFGTSAVMKAETRCFSRRTCGGRTQ